MTRQIITVVIVGLLAFVAGWWLKDFYHSGQTVKNELSQLDSIKNKKAIVDNLHSKIDTILNDDFELVIKDTNDRVNIWRKFQPAKSFTDYAVTETFKGQIPKNLNFSTCKYGQRYKTVSIETAKDGAVFAGHYAFARMGCGTSCQISTIIDLKTGNVYAGPDAQGGYEYKIDSKIILVNPPDSNGLYYPCSYCKPEQYLWTDNRLKRLE